MFSTNITINLYLFEELSPKAQARAIEDHRQFELEVMEPYDFISGDPEYDTDESLNEAYRCQREYYLNNDEPIIENILMNEYLFYESGELATTVTYCGKHKLSGETHFLFNNREYLISNINTRK